MKAGDINTNLISGYLRMLGNLSDVNKLDLISGLTKSLKVEKNRKQSFKKSFGAFESTRSADTIIKEIKDSRTFNRQMESF